jgi:hypothetical protein
MKVVFVGPVCRFNADRQQHESIEFKLPFGDPETQVILPLLESDLLEILQPVLTAAWAPWSLERADGGLRSAGTLKITRIKSLWDDRIWPGLKRPEAWFSMARRQDGVVTAGGVCSHRPG